MALPAPALSSSHRRGVQVAPVGSVVMAALAAAWSAAVVDERLLHGSLPGPAGLVKVLPYAMPALVLASLLVERRRTSRLDEAVILWVILVLMAVLLIPSIDRGSLVPLAIPAVAVVALAARRWPAATLFVVGIFSAGFGSLQAFWNFPVEKSTALLLAALWVVWLAGLLFRGTRPLRISGGIGLLGLYLLITGVMVLLASDHTVAYYGAKDSAWFMLVVPLIAYAGWDRATHERITKAILIVAVVAGAYALYRVVAGPAVAEYRLMALTQFNFVNGKLKPGGSFGSAQNMGTWMAAVVPFCFAALLSLPGRWRIVAGLGCGLCTVALLESQLRIGLVGIVFGLVLVLVLYQRAPGFPGLRLGTTLAAALVGVALVALGLGISGNQSSHSFKALLHPTSDASFKARQYKWSQALKDLDTHPFGYGVGSASYAQQVHGQTYFAAGDTNVDNGFLRVALEQGLVIMGLFALALVAIMLALIRGALRERDQPSAGIVIGAAGTLLSFLIVMLAEDATYNPRSLPTWMIVGLGMAVVVSRRSRPGHSALPAGGESR